MTIYGKRGMGLESMLEWTNNTYKSANLALIDKIPTPWRVYFDKKGKGSKATPKEKSSVDFGGTMKGGKAVYFEAKSTQNKTSFPLNNIELHQINYLYQVQLLGGIAFFIIEFSSYNERYMVPVNFIATRWNKKDSVNRGDKSITLADIQENGWLIPTTSVPVDYLKVVKEHLLKEAI